MKTYQTESGLAITGEGLGDAIEKNLNEIVKHLRIDNIGCRIDNVAIECDEKAQVATLNMTVYRSDGVRGYDPAEDIPKLYSLRIKVSEDDYPIHFEYRPADERKFDPFDDAYVTGPSMVFGVMLSLIDEIGRRHCIVTLPNYITSIVSISYPLLSCFRPFQYAEICISRLMACKPKVDKETVRMMARVFELMLRCLDYTEEQIGDYLICKARSEIYFKIVGKITALEAIRKEKGLTLEQVADASQMSVMQLKRYEKRHGSTLHCAAEAVRKRLADALGVKISEIVDEFNEPILVKE